jgi:hypothetical protein
MFHICCFQFTYVPIISLVSLSFQFYYFRFTLLAFERLAGRTEHMEPKEQVVYWREELIEEGEEPHGHVDRKRDWE